MYYPGIHWPRGVIAAMKEGFESGLSGLARRLISSELSEWTNVVVAGFGKWSVFRVGATAGSGVAVKGDMGTGKVRVRSNYLVYRFAVCPSGGHRSCPALED